MTCKKQADIELSLKLQKNSIITTPESPFEKSQQQEINSLVIREVFEFVQYNPNKYSGVRIFNSRLVNKVKGKTINTPFEKSRLVVQAYNDKDKD